MAKRAVLAFDPIEEASSQWVSHGWEEAVLGMAAVTSVMRAQQIFLTQVDEVLRPRGLTFSRYEVLVLLSFSRRGALPLGKVGERLQVHPASVTNAIDRLEAQALVARRPHPRDGRTTLAAITPAGRRLALVATADLNDRVFSAVGLTAPEARRLFSLLYKVRRSAGDFVPAPGREAKGPSHQTSPRRAR
ncbi:MAG: MarR family winged helix-turn-helix transcriptional regulator [Acidimicrobiales bacterium]